MDNFIDNKTWRFLVVGIINTIVGTLIMFCLYNIFGCSYWVSSVTNYVSVSILSYILNKKYTFRYTGETFGSILKFIGNIAVCYVAAYGIAKPLMKLVMNESSVYLQENIAMLTGMVIFTVLNYIGQRYFVFGEPMEYEVNYDKWMSSPYINEEEKDIIREMSDRETYESFYTNVEFGTAGMRGKMGLGPNCLNKYTIRLAARGMAELMGQGAKVAIAYDTRNFSEEFARESAMVLGAYGIEALLFDRCSPVPLLSYAVRELNCDGGIVITASHNKKNYNGFKTYNSKGVQMGPEDTAQIFDNMKSIDEPLNIEQCSWVSDNIKHIGDDVCKKFLQEALSSSLLNDEDVKSNLNIIYTPLFGSGRDFVKKTLEKDGFRNLHLVEEQSVFNGDFPGLEKPNPEEEKVFRKAVIKAQNLGADIIIATDPDSDRLGVGVMTEDGVIYLSGNQTGALLTDFITEMKGGEGKALITTVVTGDLGSRIAESRGAEVTRTLTGSKYVCDKIDNLCENQLIMGYEESYGYVATDHVRDKDGISAALLVCEMAAYHKSKGKTLEDRLNELYEEYGYYIDDQDSFVFEGHEGIKEMNRIMDSLRNSDKNYFGRIGNIARVIDYSKGIDDLPVSNVLKFIFTNGSWMAVRPSGTEPKIKFYYCIKGKKHSEAKIIYEKAKKDVENIINCI